MTRNYELVIFDWDGTLIDSEQTIVTCMQAAFDDIEVNQPEKEAIRHVIGLGLAEALAKLAPELDQPMRAKLVDRYRYHFFSKDASEPFPGVGDTLVSLTKQGYLMAVATGKGRAGLNQSLENTGYKEYFHVTRCADETRSKPHPQMLLEILDFTGIEPHKALMVGDTAYDMELAQNAGVDAAAVLYGVHDLGTLETYQPKTCFDHISELVPWLNSLTQQRADNE